MSQDDHHKHSGDERTPLLQNGEEQEGQTVVVDFEKGDGDDPRNWTKRRKMVNVGIIALMASELRPFYQSS